MTRNTKLLSAAAMALSLVALAVPANAQFGPMGMGMRMGPMGMGMRGPMGMGGMRMAPGMGSARYREIHAPAPRRSRYREVYEEPPPRHVHARKSAPAATHGSRVTAAVPTSVTQGKDVQTNVPVSTTAQPQQTTQSQQTPLAVKQSAPVQPQVQAQPLQNPAPVVTTSTSAVSNVGTDSALPTRLSPTTRPHNCLTKLHLKDGTVILQDFCTLEQAVIKQGDGNRTETQPTAQQTPVAAPHQAPAQLARSR